MRVIGSIVLGLAISGALITLFVFFFASLPKLLGYMLDPPRIKRIREYFESAGCTILEIKPWSNHYGVRYIKDGEQLYAKCRVNMGKHTIEWVGKRPSWVTSPNKSFKPNPLRGSA